MTAQPVDCPRCYILGGGPEVIAPNDPLATGIRLSRAEQACVLCLGRHTVPAGLAEAYRLLTDDLRHATPAQYYAQIRTTRRLRRDLG